MNYEEAARETVASAKQARRELLEYLNRFGKTVMPETAGFVQVGKLALGRALNGALPAHERLDEAMTADDAYRTALRRTQDGI